MSNEAIAQKAQQLAKEYEKTCTGCAQSVVAGLLEAFEQNHDEVFRAASGLADGIGLTGDGSCGALTGACMVIGVMFGREMKDHQDMMKPMKSYLMCKAVHQDFIEQYGSCRCHDIQTKLMGRTFNMLNPADLKAAVQANMMEHCSSVAGRAARRTAELILAESQKK
jgi:C_GCAxxG_C_C family probable redox protein